MKEGVENKMSDKGILSNQEQDQLVKLFDDIKLESIDEDRKHDIATKIMNNLQKVAPVATALEEARKKVEKELNIKESAIRGKGTLRSRELPRNKR